MRLLITFVTETYDFLKIKMQATLPGLHCSYIADISLSVHERLFEKIILEIFFTLFYRKFIRINGPVSEFPYFQIIVFLAT